LARNDDGSTGSVTLPFNVNFFGVTETHLFVNNNGNVTFDAPLATFTPFDLSSTTRQIIAPFFADVDTRNPASGVVTYGTSTVDGHLAFGVNWDGVGVGYYDQHVDRLNDFQLVLIDRSDTGANNFDIEFNYKQIQWDTGDVSAVSARAGYSNGTTAHSFELPGSAVSGAFLDSQATGLIHNSNVGLDGRYVFQAREGAVTPSPIAPLPSIAWVGLTLLAGCGAVQYLGYRKANLACVA